jgi:hypothetical protein
VRYQTDATLASHGVKVQALGTRRGRTAPRHDGYGSDRSGVGAWLSFVGMDELARRLPLRRRAADESRAPLRLLPFA